MANNVKKVNGIAIADVKKLNTIAAADIKELNGEEFTTTDLIVAATGGSIATSGDYKIHTFNSSATFAVSNAGRLHSMIVVGGGGGGGGSQAGGGGAGGMIVLNSAAAGGSDTTDLDV